MFLSSNCGLPYCTEMRSASPIIGKSMRDRNTLRLTLRNENPQLFLHHNYSRELRIYFNEPRIDENGEKRDSRVARIGLDMNGLSGDAKEDFYVSFNVRTPRRQKARRWIGPAQPTSEFSKWAASFNMQVR